MPRRPPAAVVALWLAVGLTSSGATVEVLLADPTAATPAQIETELTPDGAETGQRLQGPTVDLTLVAGTSYHVTSRAPGHRPHTEAITWQPIAERDRSLILVTGLLGGLAGAAAGGLVDLFTGFTGIGALTGALVVGLPPTIWSWASFLDHQPFHGTHVADRWRYTLQRQDTSGIPSGPPLVAPRP